MAVKNVKKLGVKINGSDMAVMDVTKLDKAALLDQANVFTNNNTFDKGIWFKTSSGASDVNNIVMNTGVKAGEAVTATTGINMTLMTSDNKKHGSVVISAEQSKNSVHLAVNDKSGALGGKISVEFNGTKTIATAPIIANLKEAGNDEIITKKALQDAFADSGSDPVIPHASTEKAGIVELATDAEATTGTDTQRAVTPKALKAVTDQLKGLIDASNRGQSELAYKDYTQTGNQGEMKKQVYYRVPFNAAGKFLEFDPATGKPKAEQDGVTDHKVSYYKVMYKNNSDKVEEVGIINTNLDAAEYAKLAKANTFTEDNTFSKVVTINGNTVTKAITASGKVTVSAGGAAVTGGLATDTLTASGAITANGKITCATGAAVASGGNDVPNAGQVKTYVDTLKARAVTKLPEVGSATDGVVYVEYAE